ncbi:MAG: sugar phosphate isomerase/epimerase [Nitrospira sp.]|nr:sugar phosphate isomerase/epimerase [Nitrospira sp.]MCP9463376.1 sugar phosphate isomerase/epimerase [Nitrospira sp.]
MKIGFMQGRLSEPVDGKIQAFPWRRWREEFAEAERLGFTLMEWTLDKDRLHENPLMTPTGRDEVRRLAVRYGVEIESLTGDCFMQAPFYKAFGTARDALLADFRKVLEACAQIGIKYIVVPLVDNGRLENSAQEESLIAGLKEIEPLLRGEMKIIFESDYPPTQLADFIDRFPAARFGINYDIGNSASLGFDPEEEIGAYGHRIVNVHVKDRILGGTTVPLGSGHANFRAVFRALKYCGYSGNFILQTARAADGDHAGTLCHYRDMVWEWLKAA